MSNRFWSALLVGSVLLSPALAFADEVQNGVANKEAMESALNETQRMLTDPAARNAAATTPESKAALEQVSAVAGSKKNQDLFYALASSILGDLVRKNGGDVTKMVEELKKGNIDPASFAATLTADQKRQLAEIAKHSLTGNGQPLQ